MKKWRRGKYLINRSMQCRSMAMSAIIVFFIATISAWSIYSSTLSAIMEHLENEPQLYEIMMEINSTLLARGAVVLLIAISGAVILTLFITHRTAGPIFRMSRTLREIASGKLPRKVTLRKKDEFKELSAAVNAVIETAETINRNNAEVSDNIHRLLDDLPEDKADKIKNETGKLIRFKSEG